MKEPVTATRRVNLEIPAALMGRRLDQALSDLLPEYSRSRIKQWIDEGLVRVDGRVLRPKERVVGGEAVELDARLEADTRFEPEAIPLAVVHEDGEIIVIDKPAGLVVHPAAGNWEGTLLNALLHRFPELATVPRAGIVHRIDKETSGLLVVARTLQAQTALVEQLQARTMSREYEAVVVGAMTGGGRIEAPIDRHPVDRKRMAVVQGGRPAVTHYRIEERFRAHTHLKVRLETGRTHQIRVHLAHLRYPLVGDPVYGGRMRLPAGAGESLLAALRDFPRQALHATRLGLLHPASGGPMEWTSPLPADIRRLLALLREETRQQG